VVILTAWVFWVISSIVLHELAHGWAALRCGDDTPRATGHMTINPLVHMGGMSLIMFAVVGIAWGAMPVNPSNFRGRHDDAKVAFAGPLMNIALAALCIVGYAVWGAAAGGHWSSSLQVDDPAYTNIGVFFRIGAGLSVVLALFNLIPVPPLDGSRIIASFVPAFRELTSRPQAAGASMILFILVFIFAGRLIFPLGFGAAADACDALTRVLVPVGGP
jgi:Zn-dependent protease